MSGDVTFEDTNVVCRKAYRCIWCGEGIAKGTTAHLYKGIWQGDFQHWHMHPECNDARIRDYGYHADDGFEEYSMYRGSTWSRHDQHDFTPGAVQSYDGQCQICGLARDDH